jgi:hypothetical protein
VAEGKPDDELVESALGVLRRLYGAAVTQPRVTAVTRWVSDPYARGAYSYVAVGSSGKDYDLLGASLGAWLGYLLWLRFVASKDTARRHLLAFTRFLGERIFSYKVIGAQHIPPIGPGVICVYHGFVPLDMYFMHEWIHRNVGRLPTTLAADFVRRLGVKAGNIFVQTRTLSGGNQQKVALARWLANDPRILILDEPTQGIDVGAKAEIHRIMVEFVQQGMAIILISSELSELLGMSDRIAVLRGGRLAGVLPAREATRESVLKLAMDDAA